MSRYDLNDTAISIVTVSSLIREEKIDELEKFIVDEQFSLNEMYPYPMGCIFIYNSQNSKIGMYEFKNSKKVKYLENTEKFFGDEIQWTPLQYASALGDTKIMDLLTKLGSNPEVKDKTGKTAKEIFEKKTKSKL
eukprot:gene2388-2852_t